MLIIGRGVAGQRYFNYIKNLDFEIDVCFYDRTMHLEKYDFIIIASSTRNHINDLITAAGHSENYFIEKPMVVNEAELIVFQELYEKKGYKIFTGDQFYFSDVLRRFKQDLFDQKLNITSVEIIYSDLLNNVTKNNDRSYFYEILGGGVLKTFSHAYFAFSYAFLKSDLELQFVDKHYSRPDLQIPTKINTHWVLDKRTPIKVQTDVEANELIFKGLVQTGSTKIFFDFINGTISNNKKFEEFPTSKRSNLIEKNFTNFISLSDQGQYNYSTEALWRIWEVENW